MKSLHLKEQTKPFSVWLFVVTVIVTLTLYNLGVKFIAPDVWKGSQEAPMWKWLVVFVVATAGIAFVEHFFHRYWLHATFLGIKWFKRLHRQHTLHHRLTPVGLRSIKNGQGSVFNQYPIITASQHEASYFPWYSLTGFLGASLLFVVPLQMFMPSWPIVFGVALAITNSLVLYEIIHMIEHWSFPIFWAPKISHPIWGRWLTKFYCFHLRHHRDIKSNENISGFFGFPLADMVLGTYAPWPRAFMHGEKVPQSEFEANPPRPRWPVRFLDSILLSS